MNAVELLFKLLTPTGVREIDDAAVIKHIEPILGNFGSSTRRTLVPLIVAVWAATIGAAQAQELGSAQQGLRLARAVCAECHLVDKVPGRSPNIAAPTFERIANVSGMTSAALTAALRTSHETMPNIIIKGSDIGDLVAYILSLKDSN